MCILFKKQKCKELQNNKFNNFYIPKMSILLNNDENNFILQ